MAHHGLSDVLQHLRRLCPPDSDRDLADAELLERFVTRLEETAFAILVQRHGPMVLAACQRVLRDAHAAEDAFHATFLVLVRRGAVIHKRSSLAGWLYRVAQRIALDAREQQARRQKRERRPVVSPTTEVLDELSWQELRAVLDEELGALPERYRLPFVLCHLEGKSYEQAARELGWAKSSLATRITRGRELLRRRLARRGLALSAAGLLASLSERAVGASVPALLMIKTVNGVLAAGGKVAAALGMSAQAVTLAEESMKGIAGLKSLVLPLLLAVALLAGGAGVAVTGLLAGAEQASAESKALTAPPSSAANANTQPARVAGRDPKKSRAGTEVCGRVLGIDGKPLGGAELLLFGQRDIPVKLGVSAAGGWFSVLVPTDRKGLWLVARAAGAGVDFVEGAKLKPGADIELRLVADQPIRGRVVDSEGKPVAGSRVSIESLDAYDGNSLDFPLAARKKEPLRGGLPAGAKHLDTAADGLFGTATDKDGRFEIRGAGTERLIALHFHGAGQADTQLAVANRRDLDPKPYNEGARVNIPRGMDHDEITPVLSGPDVEVITQPEKPIHGLVKDATTQRGRAGVNVFLTRYGEVAVRDMPSAKTDAEGRYTIHGARKAKSYRIEVQGEPMTGYLPRQVVAPDTPGYEPIRADLDLVKGVVISGKVLDKSTGKGIPAFVAAWVLAGNRFQKDYPNVEPSSWHGGSTAQDGSYQVVTIPGVVLLTASPDAGRHPEGDNAEFYYKPGIVDPKYPQYFTSRPDLYGTVFYVREGSAVSMQSNYVKVLEIQPGIRHLQHDIELEPASARVVAIQDAEGQPVCDTWVRGLGPVLSNPIRCEAASCNVYDLKPGKRRLLVIWQPQRHLVASVTLRAQDQRPAVVKLDPPAALKGRLIGADGKALSGAIVNLWYRDREAVDIYEVLSRATQVFTDATGAFAIKDAIPELTLEVLYRRGRQESQTACREMHLKAGESRDLGDIKLPSVPAGAED